MPFRPALLPTHHSRCVVFQFLGSLALALGSSQSGEVRKHHCQIGMILANGTVGHRNCLFKTVRRRLEFPPVSIRDA